MIICSCGGVGTGGDIGGGVSGVGGGSDRDYGIIGNGLNVSNANTSHLPPTHNPQTQKVPNTALSHHPLRITYPLSHYSFPSLIYILQVYHIYIPPLFNIVSSLPYIPPLLNIVTSLPDCQGICICFHRCKPLAAVDSRGCFIERTIPNTFTLSARVCCCQCFHLWWCRFLFPSCVYTIARKRWRRRRWWW